MWKGCAIITAFAVGAPIRVPQYDLIFLNRNSCACPCYFSDNYTSQSGCDNEAEFCVGCWHHVWGGYTYCARGKGFSSD